MTPDNHHHSTELTFLSPSASPARPEMPHPVKQRDNGHAVWRLPRAYRRNDIWICDATQLYVYESPGASVLCAIDKFSQDCVGLELFVPNDDSILTALERVMSTNEQPNTICLDSGLMRPAGVVEDWLLFRGISRVALPARQAADRGPVERYLRRLTVDLDDLETLDEARAALDLWLARNGHAGSGPVRS